MNRFLFAALLAISTVLITPAWADPGTNCHFHGKKTAAQTTIMQCADQRKTKLIEAGKLEKSWAGAPQQSIGMIDGKKGKEWRVIYQNPTVTDKAKSSLYLFFTPPGNFIAANHTGE
jgi:hypothetical protein